MVIKASRVLGLLEESAKLRQEIQDVQGQFLQLLHTGHPHMPPAAAQPLTPQRPRTATATASPVLRALAGKMTRAQRSRPDTPLKGASAASLCRRRAARQAMDKENMCHNVTLVPDAKTVAGCPESALTCSPVLPSADKDRSLRDISQISHITRTSFREQPSTADLSGNFHSTFNYPLHSTLNYPLSSTINMEGPGEGLEVSVDEDATLVQSRHSAKASSTSCAKRQSTRSPRRSRSNRSSRRSTHSRVPPTEPLTAETEIDVDCDSSVLSELVDDITLDQIHHESRSGTPSLPCDLHQRGLKRQTGQTVLSQVVRAPVALSESDFITFDTTLRPSIDMTQADVSLNATRGSFADPNDLTVISTRPPRDSRLSHRSRSSQGHAGVSRRSRPSATRRLPPCGQESDLDSGVSMRSTPTPVPPVQMSTPSRRAISTQNLHPEERRALAKKLKRFGASFKSSDSRKPKLQIKTLGLF